MATKSKGSISHFAISVPDPWEAAEFYTNAFGLEELGETDSKLAEGVFLTDGVVNLALLKFKDDGGGTGDRQGLCRTAPCQLLGRQRDCKRRAGDRSGRYVDHGRSEQQGRLRGEVLRPDRRDPRHQRERLGRCAEEPRCGGQRPLQPGSSSSSAAHSASTSSADVTAPGDSRSVVPRASQ